MNTPAVKTATVSYPVTTPDPYYGVIRIKQISTTEIRGYVGLCRIVTLILRPPGRWTFVSSTRHPTDASAAWLEAVCVIKTYEAATALAFDAA